jgi:inorganic pyrophosphatase
MNNLIKVFIENPAGSRIKNIHDEKTLEFKGGIPVARAYPFPYGFILDTTSEDGDNLDCYVLTNRALCRGDIVECSVMGLMEQFEDGEQDHNILATLVGESVALTEYVKSELKVFVNEVFCNQFGKSITAGEFLDAAPALNLIKQCRDKT